MLGAVLKSGKESDFELQLPNVTILGKLPHQLTADESKTPRPMTIGLLVEFRNVGLGDLWIYSPCLARGSQAVNRLPAARRHRWHTSPPHFDSATPPLRNQSLRSHWQSQWHTFNPILTVPPGRLNRIK